LNFSIATIFRDKNVLQVSLHLAQRPDWLPQAARLEERARQVGVI
jgi:hypothetical protein